MTDKVINNLKLRSEIRELAYSIDGDVEHGECFYDKEMLADFCKSLDRMKELALEYYISNKDDMEEDN
jgi:hypothetical protein